MKTYRPLRQLILCRLREFYREPAAVFWTYGFPLVLAIALGIAFREKPTDKVYVDIVRNEGAESVADAFGQREDFECRILPADECKERLRMGKSSLTIIPGQPVTYRYDPKRPESNIARLKVNEVLQNAKGRTDPIQTRDQTVSEPGSRYIDFLIPGLLGMNLLGGGMWGVGFVIVDLRRRKLFKRYLATPMRRSDFLLSLIGARLTFLLPEVFFLLLAGYLIFDVAVRGSLLAILLLSFVGAMSFAGLGLLVASRAQKLETVSGLMNLVMLPMWMLSGIFFSSERFPDVAQPFIQALPLTQLNNALRAVILEGQSVLTQGVPVLIIIVWGVLSFVLALKWFRWN